MLVQTEIDRIITAVAAAHEKIAEKGGATAEPYLVGNLASAIDTIPNAAEPALQAKVVIPGTETQYIRPDSGYDGLRLVEVEGDANLVPEYIREGVGIFGVEGTYTGDGGGGGSRETCTVSIGVPSMVAVFGWGRVNWYYSGSPLGEMELPSLGGPTHAMSFDATAVFEDIPVGSVFTFWAKNGTFGICTVTGDIEFSLANPSTRTVDRSAFAMCRCNGDGTLELTLAS